jgi:hypothetical protein
LGAAARENLLKIRAFDKSPRAFYIDKQDKRVIITAAHIENNVLVIDSVIPEGKKEMSYADYTRNTQ